MAAPSSSWSAAAEHVQPAIKNDPRAGCGARLPDNEVVRTAPPAARSRFLWMMCRTLERNTAEELKARSHRGMVECTVEYAKKYCGSPPKIGLSLFLSETVIAGRNSVPTAKQVLNTPGATIFFDLGNGRMKGLFMILRGYGLNRLSPKDQCTINGLTTRKAEYVGDIIEAVLYLSLIHI